MKDNMIELKKDALSQKQSGDWKASFTLQADDMPDYLLTSPMGRRFYVVFVDADAYDESEGENHNVKTKITPEKSDGEKMRQRACILCKDAEFQCFLVRVYFCSGQCSEAAAKATLCNICNIESRSELTANRDAQMKFIELMDKFDTWKFTKKYSDQLERVPKQT